MSTMNDIITLPNSHLRQPSIDIDKINDSIKNLIKDMESATLDWEDSRPHEVGVALAAVQIDDLRRVVVVRNDFDNKDDRTFFTLINPIITKAYGNIIYDYEGCLSVKDIYGKIPRFSKVKISALSIDGEEISLNADGFLARILQHEIDHTNGKLFIDHIKDQDAFYTLNDKGQLDKLDYDTIKSSPILW